LARASDQIRPSDVTLWGVVALVTAGIALLSANLSALLPDSIFAALHASRLTGATVNQMHAELTSLEQSQGEALSAGTQLKNRFENVEHDTIWLQQRIAALEVSIPKLTEAINIKALAPAPDASIITGSIGAPSPGFVKARPADPVPATATSERAADVRPMTAGVGATASVAPFATGMPTPRQPAIAAPAIAAPAPAATPVPGASDGLGATAQPMPAAIARPILAPTVGSRENVIAEGEIAPNPMTPASLRTVQAPAATAATTTTVATADPPPGVGNVTAIGIAIGPAVQPPAALQAWQGIAARVGIMLVGTSPLLSDDPAGTNGKVLVAGPLPSIAAATQLCANITKAGLKCMPMPYVGAALTGSTGGAPKAAYGGVGR
jgi:hypothetical protein